MVSKLQKSLDDICAELGLKPQFVFDLSKMTSSQYRVFDMPKRSGGVRTICVPSDFLKSIQRLILDCLFSKIEMPEHVHGSVKGRSIVTNASGHVGKPLVVNIDISNFFGSIKRETITEIFREYFQFDAKASEVFTDLTIYGNSLPQGAPTSPTLANIAAFKLDQEIIEICENNSREYSYHYSRYVDDLTISGDTEIAKLVPDFYKIIERNGFRANPKKLKIARSNYRQKVTGVIVNQKLNVPKKIIRKVRQQLFYCEKFGYEDHCKKLDVEPDEFYKQISGLIGFIRQSRPALADEFDVSLRRSMKVAMGLGTDEEMKKLYFLRNIIGREKIATFKYNKIPCRVAPSEIIIDDYGWRSVKGFQLKPIEGWKVYSIANIEELQVAPS